MAFLIGKLNFNTMPQITINSNNIEKFGFSATFNPLGQSVLLDTSKLTTYSDVSGSGFLYVNGIAFSIIDEQGVVLASVDWANPQIKPALGGITYTLDLSSVGIEYFFQTYKIIGYIKDGTGIVYQTTQVNIKVCEPQDITSGGYVNGLFQITANCPDSVLTIKEVTKMVYKDLIPESVTKDGILTYPVATVSAVNFTNTPFTNNVIWTGQYRVNCETVAIYNLGNDMYIAVTYLTDNVFDITCSNKLQDILCCIVDLQNTQLKNCNNALGERATQQMAQITTPFLVALSKEFSGQDASTEVEYIRKSLNCKCGGNSIIQNEFTPINPSVTNIVLSGVGGTSIATPTVNGNTKTYNVKSFTYQVVKDNSLDTAFDIILDTATLNVVKYKIRINYQILASTILNTISNNSGLLTQFNSLISTTNFSVDLTNLNGGCIIDLSSISYFLSLKIPSSANTIISVFINGVTYTAPSPIAVNNSTGIEAWLNGLGLGTFNAGFSTGVEGAYVNILTEANTNNIISAVFNVGTLITSSFQKTNRSIIAFLQAVVDYICGLSAVNIFLGQNLTICYQDYNGDKISINLLETDKQSVFNAAAANALCLLSERTNPSFNNGLTKTINNVVQYGGTLIKDTTLACLDFFYTISFNQSFYYTSDFLKKSYINQNTGVPATNFVCVTVETPTYIFSQIALVGDYNGGVGYYTKGALVVNSTNASLGYGLPTSNNDLSPSPSNSPNVTSFVKTEEGSITNYAKVQTHIGSISNFDTLLRLKVMTTAQRDAIDISLLTAGLLIFNSDVTTPGKPQCYNGVSWNNLY